jgi:hypothetical protein
MVGIRGTELEHAIDERIGDGGHRWVAIEFQCQGENGPHYQILDVHHNLTRLDANAMTVVDDITDEWDLTLQEGSGTSSGFGYRTLTHDSENPREHRHLAETILRRVYGTTLANVDGIEQVDGEPDADETG